jgi:GT2 family glycosyltransferase
MTESRSVDLSVIVATYNRAASLARLLASIRRAEGLQSTSVQVLVIDNGSRDETASVLKSELNANNPYQLKILHERNPGKAHALNLGLTNASGRFILVLDDDVVIDPNALRKHLEGYEMSHYDAMQGRVLPGSDFEGNSADLDRLREYNIPVIDYGDSLCDIRGLTGTNMSFKREVVDKVGMFDVRLGPGASGFSEDSEFSIRLRRSGFRIGYTPEAIVYHELDPRRYGRAYNRDVQYRKGLSRSIYRGDSLVLKVVPDLVANCCRYGIYRLLGFTQKAYKTEGRIIKGWGYLSGKLSNRARAGRRNAV